jgi:hypothetical protein
MALYLPFADQIAKYAVPAAMTPAGLVLQEVGRKELYRTFEGYYNNTLFAQLGLAALDPQLAENAATDTVEGIYNPVTRIVDTYVNWTLSGRLGLAADPETEVSVHTDNASLEDAVLKIWQWSNFERAKLLIPYYASLFGDALVTCVARPGSTPADDKVWMEVHHPEIIRLAEFDGRGNLSYLEIEETKQEELTMDDRIAARRGHLASMPQAYTQTIIMTKTEFATLKDGEPFDFGNGASRWANPWGFVPAKLIHHKDSGDFWGLNAFHDTIPQINNLCLEATVCSQLLGQWLTPQWAIFGVGRTAQGVRRDGPAWIFENSGDAKALTAVVDFPGAYVHISSQLKWMSERHPELNLSKIRDNNVTAGVAIRAMLFDLIKLLEMAQNNYDTGIIEAIQMCITLGQSIDGQRSIPGFDALGKFEDGALDFHFDRQDLIPASRLEELQGEAEIAALQRQINVGAGLSASSTSADAASFLANGLLSRAGV